MTRDDFKIAYTQIRYQKRNGVSGCKNYNEVLAMRCYMKRKLDDNRFNKNKYLFINLRFEKIPNHLVIMKQEMRKMLIAGRRDPLPLP